MKKTIIILVILAAVVGVGYLIYRQRAKAAQTGNKAVGAPYSGPPPTTAVKQPLETAR